MLGGLKLATDPTWVHLAERSIEDILTDHAYCEQKAASTSISLIQQYPDHERLVEELSPIVTEEWGHFRMVLRQLRKRGLRLGRQRKDEYVGELMKRMPRGGTREEQLLEKLLLAAMIEARSCERFRLLAREVQDDELRAFYRDLMVAEAGHFRLFLDLACEYIDRDRVMERWAQWVEMETEMMREWAVRGDRMH